MAKKGKQRFRFFSVVVVFSFFLGMLLGCGQTSPSKSEKGVNQDAFSHYADQLKTLRNRASRLHEQTASGRDHEIDEVVKSQMGDD